MGRRVSKSFQVAPGVRVRLNAKSTSVTMGGRGAHYTVNSKGRRTATVSAPDAGISLQHQSSAQRRAQPLPGAQSSGYQTAGSSGVRSAPVSVSGHYRPTKRSWVVILLILAIVAAVIVLFEVHHNHHSYLPPLREDLKLSGPLNGSFTTAIAVEGMTSAFPPQQGEYGLGRVNATACVQSSDGWEIDLYGQVGSHPMSLSFDGDSTSFMGSADPYVGKHKLDDDPRFGGTVAFYWGSLEDDGDGLGRAPGTLLVNPGGHSGMMNIEVDTGTGKPERITGSWRCS
jgi:hypothetical protein